jgi:hypothetical protein
LYKKNCPALFAEKYKESSYNSFVITVMEGINTVCKKIQKSLGLGSRKIVPSALPSEKLNKAGVFRATNDREKSETCYR